MPFLPPGLYSGTPVYRRSRDPLITAAVIYRQEHIKRGRKRVKERERESNAASDSPRAGGPARNRYIYTYIRVHRTIDSPHFSGPSLHVRQFRMSFFPVFLFPLFSFCFLFILPAVRRNLPRPERARWLPREFLCERACRIF